LSVAPLKLPFLTEELVRATSESLEEPGWLLEDRLDALRRAETLPAESNQLFTPYLDLRQVRFADIDPYAPSGRSGVRAPSDLEGASALLHVDEDGVVERVLSPEATAAGLKIGTFGDVPRDDRELLKGWFGGGSTLPSDDAFAQVARAAFSLGIIIHVPDGVRLERPILLRSTIGAAGRGLITRTLIVLGKGARASILEEQLPAAAGTLDPQAAQSLWWGTSEVRLGEGASLDVASIQDFGAGTVAIVNRDARLDRDASLRWSLASIGSLFHKSRIDNRLEGRGSSVHQVEIGFGSGSQIFDLTSYTRHIGQDTTGDLLSKGVFLDRSRGYIKGLIEIAKTAKGTDSFLGEFSMLLDRKARSVTIPSLEIDQPDVRRAAHSSSAGPIDESQVFYLMSRGIDRETARKFIVLGFLEPVVSRVPLAGAQEHLRALLEEKWPAVASSAASIPAA
jgi:Fe-S cluster assembly scaffold protein SufB